MAFILRFAQEYAVAECERFMALEEEFAAMEERREDWPKGRRYQPYSGREPTHTLIWEHELPTLAEAEETLRRVGTDPEHEELLRKQAPYVMRPHTEIFETLGFGR